MSDSDNDFGVSPVIGVVLLVALVVILAGVVGIVFFDIGSQERSPGLQSGLVTDIEETPEGVEVSTLDSGAGGQILVDGEPVRNISEDDTGKTFVLDNVSEGSTVAIKPNESEDLTQTETVSKNYSGGSGSSLLYQIETPSEFSGAVNRSVAVSFSSPGLVSSHSDSGKVSFYEVMNETDDTYDVDRVMIGYDKQSADKVNMTVKMTNSSKVKVTSIFSATELPDGQRFYNYSVGEAANNTNIILAFKDENSDGTYPIIDNISVYGEKLNQNNNNNSDENNESDDNLEVVNMSIATQSEWEKGIYSDNALISSLSAKENFKFPEIKEEICCVGWNASILKGTDIYKISEGEYFIDNIASAYNSEPVSYIKNGNVEWNTSFGAGPSSFYNGSLYVMDSPYSDGALYKVDTNGSETMVTSSVSDDGAGEDIRQFYVDDSGIYHSDDTNVEKLNFDGDIVWSKEFEGTSMLNIDDDYAYVMGYNLSVVNKSNGEVIDSVILDGSGVPEIVGNNIYVTDYNDISYKYSFDGDSLNRVWKNDEPGTYGQIIYDKGLFYEGYNSISKISEDTGNVEWSANNLYKDGREPIIGSSYIYVKSNSPNSNNVTRIDKDTGDMGNISSYDRNDNFEDFSFAESYPINNNWYSLPGSGRVFRVDYTEVEYLVNTSSVSYISKEFKFEDKLGVNKIYLKGQDLEDALVYIMASNSSIGKGGKDILSYLSDSDWYSSWLDIDGDKKDSVKFTEIDKYNSDNEVLDTIPKSSNYRIYIMLNEKSILDDKTIIDNITVTTNKTE
jgi:FlaG/FlaF family flagellin (archaellin)